MAVSSKVKSQTRRVGVHKDTWILELPDDLCASEGFPKGTMASLTVKGNAIQGSLIRPSREAKRAAERFIEKYADFMKEIESIDR